MARPPATGEGGELIAPSAIPGPRGTTLRPVRFDGGRLAGIVHAPAGAPLCVGVLCPSILYEYQLCHRTLRLLADRLAAEGALVLRFDYTGSGDALGDLAEGGSERWTEDVGAALAWVEREAGPGSAFLVGVRLGATLAWRCAADYGGERDLRVYAWAPVVDGAGFVSGLERAHADWYARYRARHRRAADPESERGRVLGQDFPESLRADLAAVDLPERAGAVTLIETDGAVLGGPEREAARRAGAEVSVTVPAPAPWLEDPGAISPPIPARAIERLANLIREDLS